MSKPSEMARELRREQTPAEAKLWAVLRNRGLGVKFRRQHRVGRHYPYFACIKRKLFIELDGGQHAETEHAANNAERTHYLNAAGFTILRFWNNEVMYHLEGLTQVIQDALLAPLSRGEGLG